MMGRRRSNVARLRLVFTERYGTWALIAGASEGLGAAYAKALAGRGMNLLLVARRKPRSTNSPNTSAAPSMSRSAAARVISRIRRFWKRCMPPVLASRSASSCATLRKHRSASSRRGYGEL